MSIGGKKKKEKTTETFERTQDQFTRQAEARQEARFGFQRQERAGAQRTGEFLDPTAQSGLTELINRSLGLADTPLAAGLSPETLGAIAGVGEGVGGIDPQALGVIRGFAGGEFVPRGRGALDRLVDFVGSRAAREVSDVFTAAGRSGSPAQARSIAEGVTGAISPAVFGFEESEARRRDASQAQQLGAAFGIQNIESKAGAQRLQGQIAELEATGRIDAAERERLEAPFRRLGIIGGEVRGAAALLGRGQETVTQDITDQTILDALTAVGTGTGAVTGTQRGTAMGTATGTEIGAKFRVF